MAKIKDVVAITGKYTNKEGVEKMSYTNCGSVVEANGKQYLIMEVIPAPVIGKDGIPKWFLHLYDPKPKADKPAAKPDDSDVPF